MMEQGFLMEQEMESYWRWSNGDVSMHLAALGPWRNTYILSTYILIKEGGTFLALPCGHLTSYSQSGILNRCQEQHRTFFKRSTKGIRADVHCKQLCFQLTDEKQLSSPMVVQVRVFL